MLASDPEASKFLAQSAPSQLGLRREPPTRPADEDLSGSRVGPYRLLRVIGRGGMGVVYEGDRDDEQFEQQVAIKLMRKGVGDELVLQRFERERQILAALSHPNIARLLDGGVTESGRAYFVMEYVDGTTIDRYCADRALDVRERLELVCAVGNAVQFAHSNLIVHRDLKPANILVTSQGEVKLLDFGIAKLLPQTHEMRLELTETVGRVLTPAYASPEQVTGAPVTTASDVYSLGVILYELLTGRPPLAMDANSLQDIVRVLSTVDPVKPSTAVSDAAGKAATITSSRSVRRQLTGDLDSIVLMALRKEPLRRYASAGQLAADLRRYLQGLPVHAERDRASYRIRKFVRRNRRLAIAVGLLFVSLVGGLVTTTVQRSRAESARAQAEARFDDLRTLANSLLFEVHSQIENLPGSTEAQQLIVRRGLEYLNRLAAQSTGDPDLRREVAEAYIRLGGVQGQMSGANLGDRSGALDSYEHALAIAEELTKQDAEDLLSRRTRALATEKLGDLMALVGNLEAGVGRAREALSLFSSLAEAEPELPGHQLSAAISHVKLGDLLGHPLFPNIGDKQGAVEQYDASLAKLELLPDSGPTLPGKRRYLGLVSERLGFMHRTSERWEEARVAFERSLAIRSGISNPSNFNSVRDVAVTQQNLCGVYPHLGEGARALALCQKALATYESQSALDPASVGSRADVASGLESLGYAFLSAKERPNALDALGQALAIREGLLRDDPQNVSNRERFGRIALELCRTAADDGGTLRDIRMLSIPGIETTGQACERGRTELLTAVGGELAPDDASMVEAAWTAAGLEVPGPDSSTRP